MQEFKNITALDIQKTEFKKQFKGYNIEQVRAFLDMISTSWSKLIEDNNKLTDELNSCKIRLQEQEKMQNNLKTALLNAEKYIEERKKNAQKEADIIVQEAQIKADTINKKAQQELNETKQELKNSLIEKERFLNDLKNMLDNLYKMWEIFSHIDK